MYRHYEDPRGLTKEYERKKAEYDRLLALDAMSEDEMISRHEDLAELEERINFAWQDEEFEANYARDNYDPDLEEMMYHEEDWE